MPRDNYFVTATGMVVDNATGAVFPATQLLQLRSLVDDVQLTVTLHLAHFQNYNESGPGGNLSNVTLDVSAPGRQVPENDTAISIGIWSVTHTGSCEIAVPDATYSCDRESVQCKEDAWPIPGGERNHSTCMMAAPGSSLALQALYTRTSATCGATLTTRATDRQTRTDAAATKSSATGLMRSTR